MTERYYTYTVSHCSKAIKYGLYWLINELEKYDSEKGGILTVGKGNFCDLSSEVYKEGLGKNFVKKICKFGHVSINGKIIELQYPRNMNISSLTSIVVIYPYESLINKIEDANSHYRHNDRFFSPPNLNPVLKSMLIIPWVEFSVDNWIEKYNPYRIDIDCAEYYRFGSCRKL
jgi:hypothetical protein